MRKRRYLQNTKLTDHELYHKVCTWISGERNGSLKNYLEHQKQLAADARRSEMEELKVPSTQACLPPEYEAPEFGITQNDKDKIQELIKSLKAPRDYIVNGKEYKDESNDILYDRE